MSDIGTSLPTVSSTPQQSEPILFNPLTVTIFTTFFGSRGRGYFTAPVTVNTLHICHLLRRVLYKEKRLATDKDKNHLIYIIKCLLN